MNKIPVPRRHVWNLLWIYLTHQGIVFGSIFLSKVLYVRKGVPDSFAQILTYLTNWDGQWYLRIATQGYDSQSAAFFPLFPAMIRIVNFLGIGWNVAALMVSNLALLGLIFVFYHLLRLDYPERLSLRGTWYLMLFPTSLFFSASYTESLFLFLVLTAFYNARRQRWLMAGMAGMLAALTRNWGVFVTIPLAYEYFSQVQFDFRGINARVAWLLLIPTGLAGYMAYLAFNLGDPLAFVTAQSYWKRSFTFPWQAFGIAWQNIRHHYFFGANLLDLIFSVTGLGLILAGIRKIRVSYLIYAGLGLLIPLWAAASWAGLLSMPRFVIVLFPIFISLAVNFRNPEAGTGLMAVMAGFLAYFSVLFAQSRWVA